METLLMKDTIDYATTLEKDNIKNLLDGQGFVELIDFHPRIVPKGYTPEYLIVQAARTSYGQSLKTPQEDNRLLDYLFYNKHTSPLEMCNVTFRLRLPMPIAVHFLRHRTGKFNQYSQRYSEVDEELGLYNPTKWDKGIRFGSTTNKQGSEFTEDKTDDIINKLNTAYDLQNQILDIYHSLIKEDNLAKEISRFLLPQSQYTTLYMQFDLNNLTKLLYLRDDPHAQFETQIYAKAINELCEPLFPRIFEAYKNSKFGLTLQSDELEAFNSNTSLKCDSISRNKEYPRKIKRLKCK